MKILYFDCCGGISGNMILGALLDLGIPVSKLTKELKKINILGWKLHKENVMRNGINTTRIDFSIHPKGKTHVRHLNEIMKIINKSRLKTNIKEKVCDIFHLIGKTESKIHKQHLNTIHLHELGGEDTILDVAGTLILLDILKIEKIYCSEIPLGQGKIQCMHGLLPLPAPATSLLLKGLPVYGTKIRKEVVTPTGAAIISYLSDSFGPLPKIKIKKIGYGSGNYEIKNRLSFLRVFLGEKI